MVKLNVKYLIRRNKSERNFLTRKKGDSDEDFLKGIMHLSLENRYIEKILKMDNCVNVKALYLQGNLLTKIENMENFPNLTHLYLQRNFIGKMENLNCLPKLKKIYLGHNEIQILEGLDKSTGIKEIHLENQDLPAGETMLFEPLTVRNLAMSLEVLNVSNNCLTSVRGLENLKLLKIFNASNNCLGDIEDVTRTISGWHFLRDLNLTGNEVTKVNRYRNSIILATKNLEVLDHSPVHPNTRIYLENLAEQKKLLIESKRKEERGENEAKGKSKTPKFAEENGEKKNFLDFFGPTHRAYLHPCWKLRDNVNSTNTIKFLPRPYWKKGGIDPGRRKFQKRSEPREELFSQ